MMNIKDWIDLIPRNIKQHSIIWLLASGIIGPIATGSLMNWWWSTYRIEGSKEQIVFLQNQLLQAQQRLATLEATVNHHEGVCATKLQDQAKDMQTACSQQIAWLSQSKATQQQGVLSTIANLKQEEKNLQNELNHLYLNYKNHSRNAGYRREECDHKEDKRSVDIFSNPCGDAASSQAFLAAMDKQIDSKQQSLAALQEQIKTVQSALK